MSHYKKVHKNVVCRALSFKYNTTRRQQTVLYRTPLYRQKKEPPAIRRVNSLLFRTLALRFRSASASKRPSTDLSISLAAISCHSRIGTVVARLRLASDVLICRGALFGQIACPAAHNLCVRGTFAVVEDSVSAMAPPDTGTLRGDLETIHRRYLDIAAAPQNRELFAWMVSKALICRMAKESRRGEQPGVAAVLEKIMPIKWAEEPATIEGGDVVHAKGKLIWSR